MNMYDCGTFKVRGRQVGLSLDIDSIEDDGQAWFSVLDYSSLKHSDFIAVPMLDMKGRRISLVLRDGSVEHMEADDKASADFARFGVQL